MSFRALPDRVRSPIASRTDSFFEYFSQLSLVDPYRRGLKPIIIELWTINEQRDRVIVVHIKCTLKHSEAPQIRFNQSRLGFVQQLNAISKALFIREDIHYRSFNGQPKKNS